MELTTKNVRNGFVRQPQARHTDVLKTPRLNTTSRPKRARLDAVTPIASQRYGVFAMAPTLLLSCIWSFASGSTNGGNRLVRCDNDAGILCRPGFGKRHVAGLKEPSKCVDDTWTAAWAALPSGYLGFGLMVGSNITGWFTA
jgi:hypothetical protein